MISKIKMHIFLGTMAAMFSWYYLVDSLPRSQLIPEYVTGLVAAAQSAAAKGELAGLAVPQPNFYLDNPVVSVAPRQDGGLEIRFSQTSKRRCEQITSSAAVKSLAAQVTVSADACRDINEVTLVVPSKE